MSFDTTQFWDIVLNGMTATQYMAYAFLMFVGAVIHFTIDVERSVRKDTLTPKKFSFRFLVWDNILRILGVFVAILAVIPYFETFVGVEISPKLAIVFGLTIDVFIGRLAGGTKNLSGVRKSREKFIKKLNGDEE